MIKPKWHPASEKPKDYGSYLTILGFENGKYRCMDIMNYGKYNDGDFDKNRIGWHEYDRKWGCVDYNEDVLYWMELPEMPKE